jgi:WD repeat-containing protein 35
MFEGILKGIFDFDYAPSSVRLSLQGKTLRRWINVSKEGQAAIDQLWKHGFINGLKLSSDDFQPITAYQVSNKGCAMLQMIQDDIKQEVEGLVFPPLPYERKVMQVSYKEDTFHIYSGGYRISSAITQWEDVSYVSSPYLPGCLRSDGYFRLKERSNKDRVAECATGLSSITKKTHEAITLGKVYALVGEWVPFGSNQIVALNERMGALDRCQGGILTSIMDSNPTGARFDVPIGATQVRILDFDFVNFINFEAESHLPESKGIVQIEHFGMHLNSDGSLIYGIKVEAIMDRKEDDISIDHLSRLLVDVHQDSSLIVNDLLSQYQLSLLDMLYLGDTFYRNKYNCILAREMKPALPASSYIKNECYENEIAQVIGDLYAAYDISKEDVLLLGKTGCLFSGPNFSTVEKVFVYFVGLACRDIFMTNFFARTFVLDSTLKSIRNQIHEVHQEHATVVQIREKLAVASKDTILLAETLEYLLDSLEECHLEPASDCAVSQKMFELLQLKRLRQQTIMRCHDSIKLMKGTMLQLEQLQMIAESMATNQLELACRRLNLNTQKLMDTATLQQYSYTKLNGIKIFCGGIFAFDVVDRLSGGTWNIPLPSWFEEMFVKPIFSNQLLWWALNFMLFVLVICMISKCWSIFRSKGGTLTIMAEINRKILCSSLHEFLDHQDILRVNINRGNSTASTSHLQYFSWRDNDSKRWNGANPIIEICFDEKHEFLLYASICVVRRNLCGLSDEICIQKLHESFKDAKIYIE